MAAEVTPTTHCFGSKAECQVVSGCDGVCLPHSNQDSKRVEGAGDKMSLRELPQGPVPPQLSPMHHLPPKVALPDSSLSKVDPITGSTYGRDQSPYDPSSHLPKGHLWTLLHWEPNLQNTDPSHSGKALGQTGIITHGGWDISAQALGKQLGVSLVLLLFCILCFRDGGLSM